MFEPGRRAQLSTSMLELVSSRFTRILSCAYAYACGRTCEPALRARKGSFGAFFKRSRVVVVVSFSLAGAVIVVCIRSFMQEILQTKIE